MEYKELLTELENWTRKKAEEIGCKKAIIGISGGKDSSVVAGLMVRILRPENVYGVLMPQGNQHDIDYAYEICDFLNIERTEVNIGDIVDSVIKSLPLSMIGQVSKQTTLNIPPRVRMTLLYAISQSIEDSRVINTSNLSEDYVGYATMYGDTAGAMSPLGGLTTEEVIQVGNEMGIPLKFLVKIPEDGLTRQSDEAVLGVSYHTINELIRTGKTDLQENKDIVQKLYQHSRFKMETIPKFIPSQLPYFTPDGVKTCLF